MIRKSITRLTNAHFLEQKEGQNPPLSAIRFVYGPETSKQNVGVGAGPLTHFARILCSVHSNTKRMRSSMTGRSFRGIGVNHVSGTFYSNPDVSYRAFKGDAGHGRNPWRRSNAISVPLDG